MSIRVALHHRTSYDYDRPIELGPQVIRLRPAAHSRTPILSYSLKIEPSDHFVNWQQDPNGNYQARIIFPEKVRRFQIDVDLIAEMTVINPFDFFMEPDATEIPFTYAEVSREELAPYLVREEPGPLLRQFLDSIDVTPRRTIDFLVELNQRLQHEIQYVIRMEPGVQACEETLSRRSGSCRDSALLLMQVLRHLGMAARFTSGYLIQLKPDEKPLDGPAGAEHDFTDLHAWTEVFLPGAGWIGFDPTSGLLAGEGHIPLACTPSPYSAAPITGTLEQAKTEFGFSMTVQRVHEDPRISKPYTEEQWETIEALGHTVDAQLIHDDVRLTMGGEPTFVSVDDMEGDEWRTAAMGPNKRRLAEELRGRLFERFASGGLLHSGQGKWYPGESLPRWALRCYWRRDGFPLWRDPQWLAQYGHPHGHTVADAGRFAKALAERLAVSAEFAIEAFEDVFYYMWKERRLPANVDLRDSKLENKEERKRLARVFEQGITSAVGYVLPLQYQWWLAQPNWRSGPWYTRAEEMFLIPGDSPIGFRLPIKSLTWLQKADYPTDSFPLEPFADRGPLPDDELLREHLQWRREAVARAAGAVTAPQGARITPQYAHVGEGYGGDGHGGDSYGAKRYGNGAPDGNGHAPGDRSDGQLPGSFDRDHQSSSPMASMPNWENRVPTALCVEPRDGILHIFLPPVDRLEGFLELIAAIEDTAADLRMPVVIEGYSPPNDERLKHFSVTPDPGVIEVNIQPAHSWDELVNLVQGVYHDARQSRLGTEKFDLDGTHTGTGGGNHVVLGGPSPADSPFLRRPDVLRSLLGFWHNHPSLSYLFSGRFIGPTSQAPRVDEGRRDASYELQIAFEQIPAWEAGNAPLPPWLVDRVFRHLLVDGTGNTHRSEFCIDKLFSPDTSSGRLGLVEFRAFEMPPHYRMSLTQQLLLRALIARFWREPYAVPLVNWNTTLHDRFMLPYYLWQDFDDVIEDLRQHGYPLERDWFAAHYEFRFPQIGEFTQRAVRVELRHAIEPWYVLGEEPAAGSVARYVDSSVERMQVRVSGMTDPRYVLTCNGRRVPLHPTGTEGEYLAGVRYRAWQPPSCLHPTIPVDEPLVFDLLDTWNGRSLGGCQYHVGHPGGNNPAVFPVNAYEAESRRACRFFKMGHTGGPMSIPNAEPNAAYPMTLDLRKGRNRYGTGLA
jgi:uncharacterized protein (DUF2126 family)/transglutaminase-like putative cysteine protease